MAVPLFNIGGLASGLDTSAMITAILDVERLPIQQLEARKSDHQVEDNAWQAIKTRYSAIRTALNDLDSTSDLNKFAVASSSNENAVSVTVTGAPATGATSFTVDRLAVNHQLSSNTNFAGADALVGVGDFVINKDGVDHTITTTADTTLGQLSAQINDLDIGVTASVVSIDGTDHKLILSSDETGDANTFTTSGTVASLGTMDLLQQGVDAQITLGSGGSALTLSRSSNTVTDLISGASIELTGTTTSAVTISTQRDVAGTVDAITNLVNEINSTLDTIGSATRYSPEANSGGPLVGNSTARSLAVDLRSAISSVANPGGAYPVASSLGISLNRQGTFDIDETKLTEALESDFDAVVDLLVQGGSSADSRATFVASADETVEGTYGVVITQAAARAQGTSSAFASPVSDSTFQITVGSDTVDVSVTAGQTITEVVQAINSALQDAGVSVVSAAEVNVSGSDYIELNHSAFGASAGFDVVGDPFGLAGTYAGADVAGTIGGEAATGSGQSLTASAGDPDGLILRITATAGQVSGAGGSLSLGDLTFSRGVFGTLDQTIGYAEGSGGRISRAQDVTSAQIELINDRIEVLEDRLDRRELLLIKQYAALETAMSSLQAQSSWLTSQLSSLNANAGNQ